MAGKIRSSNFQKVEEELLLRLVLGKKSVIECKKTDMQSTKSKDAAWELIAAEFNVACPVAVSFVDNFVKPLFYLGSDLYILVFGHRFAR